jgi:ammonium transporter, Amt family
MVRNFKDRWIFGILFCFLILLGSGMYAHADETSAVPQISVGLDTIWVVIAASLVFFMQAGFGMVEAGFVRVKNTCNILTKNFLDYCMACIAFLMFGYAMMFGQGNGFIGTSGWFLFDAHSPTHIPLFAFLLFQTAFCGAAASIVAGGMAERMRFPSYLISSFIISAIVYPIVGHWVWGGGWLGKMGFSDFAGSTVVHTVGGITALIGTIILKPRNGKYNSDGTVNPIPGHSIPLASLGVFILWFGWFGFNAGSTLSVGDGSLIGRIALNTNLSAAAGALTAMFLVWKLSGKPDLSMIMNGSLAGLVAVTAPCAYIDPWSAIVVGIIAGFIIVFGVNFLDRRKIDDPVGAVPVHAFNGIWGTLSIGLFGQQALGLANDGLVYGGGFKQLGIQALGSVTTIVFVLVVMGLMFKLIDVTMGLRVSPDEELKGLDIGEHGMEPYSGFQMQ